MSEISSESCAVRGLASEISSEIGVEEREKSLSLPPNINDSFDTTAANIFIANYGDNHRFIRDEKRWLHWDGAHWNGDIKALKLHIALDELRGRLKKANANYHCEKIVKALSNQPSLAKIKKHLENRAELSMLSSQCDSHPHLCAFENAIYNTDTNQIIYDPHKIRPLFLTKRFPVAYDGKALCPNWIDFLYTIFLGDGELIRFVQMAVGLSLSGNIWEEKLFFAYGTGANGKTTFFEVLNRIFGSFHQEIDSMVLIKNKAQDQRLALENMANLRGIRFATSNEIPERATYNDMIIKQLCSRDMITAKAVYKSVTPFIPTHKLWIRSNHKPQFNVHDNGMMRRICLIPFAYCVPVEARIERFEDILLKEKAGILNWLIEGWKLYQTQGMKDLPTQIKQALNEYAQECDTLRQFINECYVEHDSAITPLKDFTANYNAWCKENNYRSSNSRSLASELRSNGFEVVVGHGNLSIISGLGVKD